MSIGKPHGFNDWMKKRRIESESSTSESDTSTRNSLGKPKRKAKKPESPQELERGLPVKEENSLRRIMAQSQFNAVSQSTSKCETRKDSKNIPIYKKMLFTDSPVSNDPYEIPDTPGSFPNKSKTKIALQLKMSRKVDDETVKTPELPHNTQKRHTTSSPHPGAQLKKNVKRIGSNSHMSTPSLTPSSPSDVLIDTDMSVPEVGFNASPARRLNSSKSCVNLFKTSASLSTPVRIPEKTRNLLKSSGISTSSLRLRRPIEIDFGEDVVRDGPPLSVKMSSNTETDHHVLSDKNQTTPPEQRILSRESPFRRQRSTSVGSLQNLTIRSQLSQSDSTPKKKARSKSVERSPLISSRILRATPERMRHRSESRERSNLKKSASDRELFANLNSKPKVVCEAINLVEPKTETETNAKQLDDDDVVPSSQESVYHSSTSSPEMTKQSVISTSMEISAKNDGIVEDNFVSALSSPLNMGGKSPIESVEDVVPQSQEIEVVFQNIQSPSKEPTVIEGETSSDVSNSQDSDVVPCSQEILGDCDIPFTEEVTCVNEGEKSASPSLSHEVINLSSDSSCSSQARITRQPLKSALRSPGKENLKAGRRIQFSSLQVYYFGRIQGFHVVPVHGDIALGMEYEHFGSREFKVLKSRHPSINMNDPEESELSEGEDPGAESFIKRSDFEKDNFERQRLLQHSGIVVERQKQETEVIRKLRRNCGCSCRGGICRPNLCECSRSGVPCQVDRQEADGRFYPCTCAVASLCNNMNGRLVYDYEKVNESRRSTIQRWRDMQRTGIFASPSVKRFDNDEEDVVPDSQGEQQQEEDESSFKSSPTREDFLLDEPRSLVTSHLQATETPPEHEEGITTQRKFFPPAPSML